MSVLSLSVELDRRNFRLRVDEQIALDGITALFGPSGSGKTTFLRIVAGLERCSGGTVRCDDTVWQDDDTWLAPHLRNLGYVFQDARLFEHLTVEGNLRFPMRFAKDKGPLSIRDVVTAFDLSTLLPRKPGSLSGGETQRVAIARALLGNTRLMLMDEPLSSLDASRKREILPYIEQLPNRFEIPVLYVTHDADEVTRLADRLLIIDKGRIAASGGVAEMFERIDLWPIYGRQEASSVLDVVKQGSAEGMTTLAIGRQTIRVPGMLGALGSHPRIRIHARDIVIATAPVGNLSIRNSLQCTLCRIDFDGETNVELLLEVDSQHLRARITRDAQNELGLREGMTVYALIKSMALDTGLLTGPADAPGAA